MNIKDTVAFAGELYFYRSKSPDERGVLIQHVKNLVVTTGHNWIAQRMAGGTSPAPTNMDYMAIGQDTVAPVLSDTELRQEIARVSMAANPQVTSNRVTYTATFPEAIGTGAITEAGMFDAAVAGGMLARSVFPVVNKQVDDYITILWVISVGTPI